MWFGLAFTRWNICHHQLALLQPTCIPECKSNIFFFSPMQDCCLLRDQAETFVGSNFMTFLWSATLPSSSAKSNICRQTCIESWNRSENCKQTELHCLCIQDSSHKASEDSKKWEQYAQKVYGDDPLRHESCLALLSWGTLDFGGGESSPSCLTIFPASFLNFVQLCQADCQLPASDSQQTNFIHEEKVWFD